MFWFLMMLTARAETYDVFRATDVKGSFCTVIGGACAADPDFDGAFFQNPAALTAGPPNFDFDFDFDLGRVTTGEPGAVDRGATGTLNTMGALAAAGERFGLGVSYAHIDRRTGASFSEGTSDVRFIESQLNVPLGYKLEARWQVGVAFNFEWFHVTTAVVPAAGAPDRWTIADHSDRAPALGITIGTLYEVASGRHVGAWLRTPSVFRAAETARDTSDKQYLLTRRLARPWVAAFGYAHESSASAWSLLAELDVVGPVAGGRLFGDNDLALNVDGQAAVVKGRTISLNPRLGTRRRFGSRWTWFGGAYYESARVSGVDGQAHLTTGLSFKLPLGLSWWDFAEFMAGIDASTETQKLLLTFR